MYLQQVLALDRDSFNRLCGSLFDVLSRNMGTYEEMMASMAEAKAKQARLGPLQRASQPRCNAGCDA